MKVKVKYLMTFSQLAGKRHEEFEVSNGTALKDLINILKKSKGKEFRKYLDDSIKNNTIAFLVNKSSAEDDDKLYTGDEVIISHVVGGG
jgi:molybdopterin converting factor small subunit